MICSGCGLLVCGPAPANVTLTVHKPNEFAHVQRHSLSCADTMPSAVFQKRDSTYKSHPPRAIRQVFRHLTLLLAGYSKYPNGRCPVICIAVVCSIQHNFYPVAADDQPLNSVHFFFKKSFSTFNRPICS